MRFGSLFAGIGGLDLGLERAGMDCAWQVEIDDYCQKVLTKHWPDVPKFGDIKECGAHNLEKVDLICGGFPCQDISFAGKGAGIDGERSGLWSEYYRIICELRPEYVLVENVSALLVRGIERVLGDLASCGYDAQWDCIPAAAVGAPHRRDRVFIVAYSNILQVEGTWPQQQATGPCGESEEMAHPSGKQRNGLNDYARNKQRQKEVSEFGNGCWPENVANTTGARFQDRNEGSIYKPRAFKRPERCDWWTTEPDVGRVAHGVPARVDRLKGLGNAVVPK